MLVEGRDLGVDGAQDREIIGLGATAGKHNFLGLATQQNRHFPARSFQPLLRDLAIQMDAAGIAGHFK